MLIPLMLLDHVLTVLPATIAALAALIASIKNSQKLKDIHISLNGRLDELLRSNKIASKAEGRQEERDKHEAITNGTPKE